MNNCIKSIAIGTLLVAAAQAQEPNYGPFPYDYGYANYALSDLDSGGIELGASVEVANRVHIFGVFQDWDLDNDFERSMFRVGGGYRWAVSPTIDLVAKLAYADTEIDRPGPGRDFDDQGLIASGELRAWVSRDIELHGELSLDDSFGSDLETVLEFGGQYFLDGNFSVGGRIRVDEDDTTLLLGGRFYFGKSARRANGTRGN